MAQHLVVRLPVAWLVENWKIWSTCEFGGGGEVRPWLGWKEWEGPQGCSQQVNYRNWTPGSVLFLCGGWGGLGGRKLGENLQGKAVGPGLASPFLDTGRPTLPMLQLLGAEAHPPRAPRAMLGPHRGPRGRT